MNTVIVIGNGFDIDLGWRTSYKDFYEAKKDKWSIFKTNEDDLFQYVINHIADNWFDFERTLHEYVVHEAKIGESLDKDIRDYKDFKTDIFNFLSKQSKEPIRDDSSAYQLLTAYLEKCKHLQPSSDMFIKWFSFNYTPLEKVASLIDPYTEFNYVPVHGTINDNNIILGIHDDENIPPEYRDLQKSMDDKYESHGILSALIEAKQIIFFGLSMGYIDAVYFKALFNQLADIGSSQPMYNKKIVFITKDKNAKKDIKKNLFDMGLKPQVLFNVNNVDFILTENKEDQDKFTSLLEEL